MNMALSGEFRTLILFTVMAAFIECQITSANSKDACVDNNVDLDWVYGNTADVISVTWTYIDSQTSAQTTIMQFVGGSATVSNNFNVEYKTNGGITLTKVTKANSGSYKITVIYATAPQAEDTVAVTVNDCSSCKCECEKCKTRVGICISFFCIGIAPEVIFVVGLFISSFSRTKLVVFAAIVIVIEIIGGGVCISVPMEKCCIECCENWYKPLSIGFAVVSFLVGVAGIAEFVLVLSNRIGPGRNGGNGFFCFNNGNDGGDDGGNDGGNNGHHRGHGTNSSTVHSERADTHRGTLSDRRPMPPIPLTDKKGRGLSANYDDEHPMISVGIPDKKAGDLGPLEEESKKKKKKKKKTKNDGDEREKEENKE